MFLSKKVLALIQFLHTHLFYFPIFLVHQDTFLNGIPKKEKWIWFAEAETCCHLNITVNMLCCGVFMLKKYFWIVQLILIVDRVLLELNTWHYKETRRQKLKLGEIVITLMYAICYIFYLFLFIFIKLSSWVETF